MLRVAALSRSFGGIHAVRDVSLKVEAGELRGIIGPNGAGKSTLFNLIAGHLPPSSGQVFLREEAIGALPPSERARRGVAIVYQGARIFTGMSAVENVMVGAHRRGRSGLFGAAFQSAQHRREELELRRFAEGLLEEVGLGGAGERMAEALPLGQQRALQLARALASEPTVLLLDEPASGLRAAERSRFVELLHRLRRRGLTMLLVEHDVPLVTELSDRITVLDLGRVIAEGTPAAIRDDPAVIDAYLGTTVRDECA